MVDEGGAPIRVVDQKGFQTFLLRPYDLVYRFGGLLAFPGYLPQLFMIPLWASADVIQEVQPLFPPVPFEDRAPPMKIEVEVHGLPADQKFLMGVPPEIDERVFEPPLLGIQGFISQALRSQKVLVVGSPYVG